MRLQFFQFLATLLSICLVLSTRLGHAHGAYHDVVLEVTRALQTTPNDPALHFKLACAHQEHGEWTSALIELEHTDRLAPGQFATGFVKGQALSTGGHWQAAKPVLDTFLQTHPDHAGALAQRARVQLQLQEPAAALRDFQSALAKAANPGADLYLETATALVEAKQPDHAIETLRQGLTRIGPEPSLLNLSLNLELAVRHYDEALARVEALQQISPRPEPAMAQRARILTQAQRPAEAKAAWTTLQTHLLTLPNLERGIPELTQLLTESQKALGLATPTPVIAPPSSK